MRMFKNAIRKSALVMVVLCLVLSLPMAVSAAEFGPRYNDQAAVSYAAAHWNDGVGVCDQFVKDCLKAGGVEILAGADTVLEDNYFDMNAGQRRVKIVRGDVSELSVRSVYDIR